MASPTPYSTGKKTRLDPLYPLKRWLDNREIQDRSVAHFICRVIPCSCPFERTITVFGHQLFHIPPLCKLNPLYHQFVLLRLKALSYLADVCGENVDHYIC
ncbi:Mo-dependent nitrogenase C-terminal domain-containing protein [Crocosphaera sp. Alani8]|uniref:Mo-dependent nitrogenase C-terminal domain-containing protein n=1 Tax=Crocosphaera sp. Alani8 TaxID=3038952 RepID=UPI00313D3826